MIKSSLIWISSPLIFHLNMRLPNLINRQYFPNAFLYGQICIFSHKSSIHQSKNHYIFFFYLNRSLLGRATPFHEQICILFHKGKNLFPHIFYTVQFYIFSILHCLSYYHKMRFLRPSQKESKQDLDIKELVYSQNF